MEPRARAGKNVGKETFSARDVRALLYAFGDVRDPLPETVRVLDEIVTEFLEGVCFEASRHAQVAGRQKLKFDDFEFALRRNPQYLGKVKSMIEKRKDIKEARRVVDYDDATLAKEHGTDTGPAAANGEEELLGLDEADEDLELNIDISSKGTGSKKRKRALK
ncbi:TFIID-18kDa-domain-containing protein [Hypoxylon sp. FL0890]|nr:TFIID-18kDa-domain-containing protein [Hypoxylon sp. FL0890]